MTENQHFKIVGAASWCKGMELRADLPLADFIIGNAKADVDIDVYGSLRVTRYST